MKSGRCSSPTTETDATADRLLNVKDAATLLAIEPSTLYQWAYQRRIPVVKLLGGKALRIRLSVLNRMISDGERPARVKHKRQTARSISTQELLVRPDEEANQE